MIQTSEESEVVIYPTEWRLIDAHKRIECRQVSLDTYQLRSATHRITLNSEGFDLYRDNSPQGVVLFEDWCDRNNIESELRTVDGQP